MDNNGGEKLGPEQGNFSTGDKLTERESNLDVAGERKELDHVVVKRQEIKNRGKSVLGIPDVLKLLKGFEEGDVSPADVCDGVINGRDNSNNEIGKAA